MTIKAMIVDDEPLAGTRLRQLLEEQRDIVIAAEAHDAASAAELAASARPDVIFLDIAMPRGNGIDFAA
ncbi:MAG TPA: response regulator, partial [Thermoanaerobaculia bacterium]|nr:response regulator [Thermoanaerobaculia bacterium]